MKYSDLQKFKDALQELNDALQKSKDALQELNDTLQKSKDVFLDLAKINIDKPASSRYENGTLAHLG